MTVTSAQLLKLLGCGVHAASAPRPGGAGASATSPAADAFADLLKKAQDGGLASDLPVSVADDCGIALDDGQLARLSLAADQLEAAGVRNALVTIDGQRLLLDVHARQIVGRAGDATRITAGVDGVLDLGDARSGVHDATGISASAQGLPRAAFAAPTGNADVLALLANIAPSG